MWERQDRKEVLADGIVVTRSDIPGLLEDKGFYIAMREWNNYHRFGLPFTGGWKEQPCQLIDVIELFDSLYEKHREKPHGSK